MELPKLGRVPLLYHTLRQIPASQIAALLRHRFRLALRKRFPERERRLLEVLAARDLAQSRISESSPFLLPPLDPKDLLNLDSLRATCDHFRSGEVLVLNRIEHFQQGSYWNLARSPSTPPLVRETLHYHQIILELARYSRCSAVQPAELEEVKRWISDLLEQWWERHPPGAGEGWNPFTTAYRVQVWLKLRPLLDPQLAERMDHSLLVHGVLLERNLEKHLGANHLFKDLCGLALLASHFEGAASERWLHIVQDELPRQIDVQVLPDGGHYERSPMYHALVLEDLLDAVGALRTRIPRWVSEHLIEPVQRMAEFLEGITHSDGEIPLLNDSVLGQAPEPSKLTTAAGLVPSAEEGMVSYPEAGITRFSRAGFSLIFDHGPLGPDEQMGHAHNDALSFELAFGPERIIVDRGVFEYTAGPRRTECRSIRSHNTPNLSGVEQSEIWASFRAGRRWHPHLSASGIEVDRWWAVGAWSRPKMGTIERKIISHPGGVFVLEDRISPEGQAECAIPFRFGPSAHLRLDRPARWEADCERIRIVGSVSSSHPFHIALEESTYWPRFYTEAVVPLMIIQLKIDSPVVVRTVLGPADAAFPPMTAGEQD